MPNGLIDGLADEVLNHILRGEAFTLLVAAEGDWFLGLYTTAPNQAGGGGTEVSGGAYARQALKRSTTLTPRMKAAAAGTGTYRTSLLNNKITWPTATANWGTIVGVGLFAASSGGTPRAYFDLATDKAVNTDDIFEIDVDKLIAQLRPV